MKAAGIRHAGKVAIKRAVETARELGLDVAGYTLSADGAIHVFEARAMPTQPESLFDRLKASGQL